MSYVDIDRDKYLRHIKDPEDIQNMRRVLDLVEIVTRDHIPQATDFLNPYLVRLSQSILNRFDNIDYGVFGAYEAAEREVVVISPDYHYLTKKDYNIRVLRLWGETEGLSHRDFLGGILGQGISRDKLGDILVFDNHADIIIKAEIENFIRINLDKIGNKRFEVERVDFEDLVAVEDEYEEIYRSLSSLRLDSYISSAYNLSRKDGQNLVNKGYVKVNFEPIDRPAYEIKEKDLVSVRGFGRSKLHKIKGVSKKDRLKVDIRILI